MASIACLTPREIEVLRLVAQGSTNKAIAASLRVTQKTIEFHMDRIYGKAGVRSRVLVVLWAVREGLLRETRESSS